MEQERLREKDYIYIRVMGGCWGMHHIHEPSLTDLETQFFVHVQLKGYNNILYCNFSICICNADKIYNYSSIAPLPS